MINWLLDMLAARDERAYARRRAYYLRRRLLRRARRR